jgi:hypothetical protein
MVAVAAPPENFKMSFTCPVIGPKVYITKGPSGWPETFKRKDVDAKLVSFVQTMAPGVDVDELVGMFLAQRALQEKPEPTNWFSIVGFIGRQLVMSPLDIPHEIGIAFWGKIVIATTTALLDAN